MHWVDYLICSWVALFVVSICLIELSVRDDAQVNSWLSVIATSFVAVFSPGHPGLFVCSSRELAFNLPSTRGCKMASGCSVSASKLSECRSPVTASCRIERERVNFQRMRHDLCFMIFA